MLVDVPAGTRCCGRELTILVHDLGGPGLLAGRQIEERPIESFSETKNTELAVELIRTATLDKCRCLSRRGGVRRVSRQGLPESKRQWPFGGVRGQERGAAQAIDARESDRIHLLQEIGEVLVELRGCGRRHCIVQRIRRLE